MVNPDGGSHIESREDPGRDGLEVRLFTFHLTLTRLPSDQNYEIQHEIGYGSTSTVYIAIVKRGRLRNRHVALRKVGAPSLSGTEMKICCPRLLCEQRRTRPRRPSTFLFITPP
jgi:hypothetical protein